MLLRRLLAGFASGRTLWSEAEGRGRAPHCLAARLLVRGLFVGLALLAVTGCGATPATQASGRRVSEWVEVLHARDYRQRLKAVQVLGNVGSTDPAALPALALAVKDPDPRIRDAAVLAIMKSGPDAASVASAVESALADPDPGVGAHAAAALKRITGREPSR